MTALHFSRIILYRGKAYGPGAYYVSDSVAPGLIARGATVTTLPPEDNGTGSGAAYEETFLSPLDCWTVNHNLGYQPQVSTTSLGGVEFDGEVNHLTLNQLQVCFSLPTAGKVRCR